MHETYTPLAVDIEPLNSIVSEFLNGLSKTALLCDGFTVKGNHVTLTLAAYPAVVSRELPDQCDQPNGHPDDVPWANAEKVEEKQPHGAGVYPDAIVDMAPELPALAEEPSPDDPIKKALGKILSDASTKTVAEHLLLPLVEKALRIEGNPAKVLGKVAKEFADVPASKLEFAARHLLKGKHEVFPDYDEIYAAIGRYRPVMAREAA